MRLFGGCALLVAVLATGCTNASSPVSGDDDDDGSSDPALTIGIEPWQVEPGQDQIWCKTMKAPGTGTYDVSRIRVNMTGGSHHFILYRSDVDQADGFGACTEMDRTFITGSQTPGTYETQFPEGKAMPIFGGEQLILESHYANAGEVDVTAQVTVDFFTIAHDDVDDYLQTALLVYDDFVIPPVTNGYLDGASFNEIPGLSIWMLSSHTHSRMTMFTADRVEAGIPTRIYENTDWHAPVQTVFDPPFVGKAGNELAWACTWNNETDHPIYFGPTTDDEMCILVATFFPALDYSP
jgi:hypothetical protein